MTATKSARGLKKRTVVIALIIGTFLVIFGAIVVPISFQAMMDSILEQMMVINPKSPIYPQWEDPTLPIYTRFYFFDLQNPEEVLKGAKPSVVEKGPYSYRMTLPRVNVSFNPNDTVTSEQPYSYIFDRDQSVGNESDTFMTANMPFWGTTYFTRDLGPLVQAGLSLFLTMRKEEPFIRLSVKQLIWGYDEPLFKWVHENLPEIPLPEGFETQFGFLLGRNNSALGVYTAYTGEGDLSRVNEIDKFNGRSNVTYWKSDSANMINGSDGMMYHMGIKEEEVLYLFHPDLCRSMPYTYVKDDTLEGVPLKMFGVAPWAYQNGSMYPPNEGFDITTDDVPRGLQRIDSCRYGTPTALSNPHFFDGDPSLASQVDGLNPGSDEHRNYFSIEPILGMPFKLRMRLQINQYMEKISAIPQTGDVRTMYYPGFWFEEDVTGNEEVIGYYNMGIKLTGIIASIVQYMSIAIGASLITAFLLVGLCKAISQPKESIIKDSDDMNYNSTHNVNEGFQSINDPGLKT